MADALADSFAKLLVVALTALGSGVLALGGLVVELAALGDLIAGHVGIGVWELCFGAVLLSADWYLLGYRRVVPAVARRGN